MPGNRRVCSAATRISVSELTSSGSVYFLSRRGGDRVDRPLGGSPDEPTTTPPTATTRIGEQLSETSASAGRAQKPVAMS